jgi:hypothetical protein
MTGPSPGSIICPGSGKKCVRLGKTEPCGYPARLDLSAYVSKTQHRAKTGMSLFIIRAKIQKKTDALGVGLFLILDSS